MMFPKGVEDGVMFAVAPPVDTDRMMGREGSGDDVSGGSLGSGVVGGEGDAKGLSESNSSSGVEAIVLGLEDVRR